MIRARRGSNVARACDLVPRSQVVASIEHLTELAALEREAIRARHTHQVRIDECEAKLVKMIADGLAEGDPAVRRLVIDAVIAFQAPTREEAAIVARAFRVLCPPGEGR